MKARCAIFYSKKSDIFRYNRTYVVNFGKSIYQDGSFYRFEKGVFVKKVALSKEIMDSHLREIPLVRDLDSLVGKWFNFSNLEKYGS